MPIISYDTNLVDTNDRFDYWNDLVCDVFIGLNTTNTREHKLFHADLTHLDMETIEISVVTSDESQVMRTQQHISDSIEEVFMLHLLLEGTCYHSQNEHDCVLQPGDYAICLSSSPYALSFEQEIKMMVVKIPFTSLQRYIFQPEMLAGLSVAKSQGISGLLVQHLLELWSFKDTMEDTNYRSPLGDSVVALLASSLQNAYPDLFNSIKEPIKETQIIRLKAYINNNITNPDLTPALIAKNNGISGRYMRKIFNDAGITCQNQIINERVNAVANDLKKPDTLSLNISSVAFKWGFNNLSHFSSSFRKIKGESPKEYRDKYKRSIGDRNLTNR